MTRMLVVPSPSLSPLSTAGPLPTDGQPEWCVCSGFADRHERLPRLCSAGLADGPYPFTVAVWQEASGYDEGHGPECCTPSVGAVVATVEVTGKSHHAETCVRLRPAWGPMRKTPDNNLIRWCHDDALPDCWHTPTGTVSRLDVPIPMERPTDAEVHQAHPRVQDPCSHKCRTTPTSWWWARPRPGGTSVRLDPDRLTCTPDRHLPGCHNPCLDRTWCICGAVTWDGHVGTWHSHPVREDVQEPDPPRAIGTGAVGLRRRMGALLGWETYFLHAPGCDRAAPCVPGCHLDEPMEVPA